MFFRIQILQNKISVITPLSGTLFDIVRPRLSGSTISDPAAKVPINTESFVIVAQSEVEDILA